MGIRQKLNIMGAMLLLAVAAFTSPATAQTKPKVVVVKMVDNGGSQFRFDPAEVILQKGDTLRFVQTGTAPHNVEFKGLPQGATIKKDAYFSRFLITKGETLNIAIDGRFAVGKYTYVCTPHEALGMKASFTVENGKK